MLSSLNLCNFPPQRSLRSLSCYFVVSLCVYICVCGKILQAALQCHHITTGGWVSPRAALWVASHPCVCVREREGERALLPPHTHVQLLSSHTSDSDLALMPATRWATSFSLFPYLLLLHRPVSWYFHTSSVVSHGCYPNLTVSLLWRTGKGFSPCTGSAAVATGADTHNIIDKQTIANVFFFFCASEFGCRIANPWNKKASGLF